MIPGGGAMVAGFLILYAAIAVAAWLLGWWLWRQWRAYQGRPRPPLPGWVLLLVVIVSAFPIFTGVTLAGILWQDIQHERQEMRWKQRRNVELREARVFGEITLPAGTLLNRREPQIPGTEDSPITLDDVTRVRLPQAQLIAGVKVIAFQTAPALLELAEPHVFVGEAGMEEGQAVSCEAGWLATFTVPPELEPDFDQGPSVLPAETFQPSRWRFKNCFAGDPIRVVVLRDGEEVSVP